MTLSLHSLTCAPIQHPPVSIATNVLRHRDNRTPSIQTFSFFPSESPTLGETWRGGAGLSLPNGTQNGSLSPPLLPAISLFFFVLLPEETTYYFQYDLFSRQQKRHRGFLVLKTHDIIKSFSMRRLMSSAVGPRGGGWRRCGFKPCYS